MPLYEKLDACQKTAVRKSIRLKSCCIFFEQGVGKTHPTVAIIEELMDDQFTGLVVVPLTNLETTWLTLIRKELPKLNIARQWDEFKAMVCPKILLLHYEGMPALDKRITKFPWVFSVFDESQRLKARGSRQSRIAGRIKQSIYRIALSGTPIDDSPIDLWAQLRYAVPQLYGNDRSAWKRFDQRYLKPTGYMGYQRKFRKEKLPGFLKEIAPYIIRVEAKDVLKLPPLTTKLVPVHMIGPQERIYNKMERDFVVKIITEAKKKALAKEKRTGKKQSVRATAGLRITQMIKLQQICGGYLVDDDGEIHQLRSAKIRKLKHLLKRKVKLPTVIFCKYREEHDRIQELVESLGLTHRSITGKVKDKKRKKARTEAINLFQSGKVDVMICQVRAGGVGVDLFKARSAIFYSTTFSYIDYDQCRKRIHRRGQVNPTTLFFIFAKDTIDEDIYSTILSKRSVTKRVFNQMKRRSLRNG